ncbi:MAG: DNA gyrase subunit A [Dehalococcoidales bacterium]|nr:DNA gyrase subunit A [Dehalococcoidales bacterium]
MSLGNVKDIKIDEEVKSSYLDYAMSVIVSRALPDVRDGLKPVHRRILYAMQGLGLYHSGPHKKSARVVGEVLGKYHPHGDSSVYDAMVRMAQPFSMRHTLVDGQGNFGSVDNDPPAAMRYTEVRLETIAEQMLADLDKDTVDFMPNFDDSLQEPVVLPSRIPNLLVNGSSGIAVGMATNIPPHNLSEVCDALTYLIDNPDAGVDELMKYVKGPDFPTGGIILGKDGIVSAYATGHGKVLVRAKAYYEESTTGRQQIIVTELPFQTNKAALVEKIAELVKDKKIAGISDLRDESDRDGLRVVIELKKEAQSRQVLNALYKYTAMQSSFFVNMLALVDGQPRVISLKEALQYFLDFRHEVLTRRTKFELKGAQDRAHILEGLKKALDFIDEVIKTIRQSKSAEDARKELMSRFELTQIQAQAILDMQLRRLASLERQKIIDEYEAILKTISYLEDLLNNPRKMMVLVKDELGELKTKSGKPRKTEISIQEALDFSEEDLIPHQRMVVTLSERGFVKRVPSKSFTLQHRGGKGIIGMVTRERDAVRLLVIGDTHDTLLFFTDKGKVFCTKCHEVPLDISRISKGQAVINLFPIVQGERITDIIAISEFKEDSFLLMATAKGEVKKTAVSSFSAVRSSGLIAMDLDKDDSLVAVCQGQETDDVLIITQKGQSIRFPISELRTSLRASGGVCGIKLEKDDGVVSMDVAEKGTFVLTVTSGGHGKLTPIDDYPLQHRAGSGVITFKIVGKTGDVAAAKAVTPDQQVMIISAGGIITLTPVKEKDPRLGITVQGRSTQGVRLMKLEDNDRVVAITAFDGEDKE